MKKEALLIIFLLILPLVFSADKEKLWSGEVYSGESLNVSNKIFTFALSSAYDKISVTFPDGFSILLYDGSCEIKENYEMCFSGKEFWYHNYTTDKELYKALVTIYRILSDTAELELTRTIEDTTLFIGEETEIKTTIENIGGLEATAIVYSDTFPPEFEITEVQNALIYIKPAYSTVRWQGSLNKDRIKEISYKIKALNKTTFKSKAPLSYNNGNNTVDINSGLETITVSDYQLNVTMSLDKNKIEIGEEANMNITLHNTNDEEAIRAELILTKPNGIKITRHFYLLKEDSKYSWKETLEENGSKEFNIKLEGVSTGNYTLNIKVPFIINNIKKEIEKDIKLEVYANLLNIYYKTEKHAGKANIVIELENPGSINSFKGVEIIVESELPDFKKINKKVNIINPLERKEVINFPFKISELDSTKDYSMNVSIRYKSDYGQIFQSGKKIIIKFSGGEKESPDIIINDTALTEVKEINISKDNITENNITYEEPKQKKKNMAWLFLSMIIILLVAVSFIYIKKEMKEME